MKRLTCFAFAGTVGYGVDSGILLLATPVLGPYQGRLVSFAAAVLTTWLINRFLTFRDRDSGRPVHHEFAIYALTTLGGGMVNFGVYSVIVYLLVPSTWLLPGAVAAGSLAGMMINYWLSRTLVFTAKACE